MTLEEQVRDALDDLAARVPPRAGLADAVLREAHRRRARVRLVTAGATAVAAAAGTLFVVADPLALDGDDLGTVDPAAGHPADDVPVETGPVAVGLDLDRLPEGAAPEAPFYVDGVLHLGGQQIPFEDDVAGFRAIEEVAGGLVVLTIPSVDDAEEPDHSTYELLLLSPGGDRKVLGDGAIYDVAVSADGTRIAWAVHDWSTRTADDGPGRTLLYVADAATGDVVHQREQTGADGGVGVAKGFLAGGGVVLDNATNEPGGMKVWDPAADTVTPWTGYGYTNAVSPAGDLAVVAPGNDAAERAPAVVDAGGALLWSLTSDHYVGRHAFSPDGALLAVVSAPGLDESLADMAPERRDMRSDIPRSIEVLDARTGEPVLTVEGTDPGNLLWESATSVLFEVRNDDDTAVGLVRCSLDGQCELAAPVHDLGGGAVPYLGGSA